MLCSACSAVLVPLQSLPAPPCERAAASLEWFGPLLPRDRNRLSAWCRSVGPPVIRTADAPQRSGRDSGLVVISWNVHEGAADLARVIDAFRPADIVVLVQEAVHADESVPAMIPPGVAAPRREWNRGAAAGEIVRTAEALRLSLVYVPSMRNGRDAREDRGCAILSTLPLSDPVAIELPWVRQRRVAVMATVSGRSGGQPPMRMISAHLDNRPGRRRQSAALADWVARHTRRDEPIVIGADLNTWFGDGEETVRQIDRIVPLAARCGRRPTYRFGRRLDYMFASGVEVDECSVGASTYGSDHRPIAMAIRAAR